MPELSPLSVGHDLAARALGEPEDWNAWLVLADWLMDRDDARGQLVQLTHRQDTAKLRAGECAALEAEMAALMSTHRASWLVGLQVPPTMRLQWRFGFVVGGRLRWSDETRRFLTELRAHPTGLLFHQLDLTMTSLDDQGVATLVSAEELRSVRTLNLTDNAIGDRGAAAIAASPHLRNLRELVLDSNAVGPDGASAMAASPHLGSLHTLRLRNNLVGDDGAAAMVAASGSLHTLDLSNNALSDDGAKAIAAADLRALRRLDLSGNRIRNAGFAAIAASGLDRLDTLKLAGNPIDVEQGTTRVVAMPHRRTLRAMGLMFDLVDPRDWRGMTRLAWKCLLAPNVPLFAIVAIGLAMNLGIGVRTRLRSARGWLRPTRGEPTAGAERSVALGRPRVERRA